MVLLFCFVLSQPSFAPHLPCLSLPLASRLCSPACRFFFWLQLLLVPFLFPCSIYFPIALKQRGSPLSRSLFFPAGGCGKRRKTQDWEWRGSAPSGGSSQTAVRLPIWDIMAHKAWPCVAFEKNYCVLARLRVLDRDMGGARA
ncbi:hypothetical protein V8C34DRAFT_151733 [Trichoderma compactum]